MKRVAFALALIWGSTMRSGTEEYMVFVIFVAGGWLYYRAIKRHPPPPHPWKREKRDVEGPVIEATCVEEKSEEKIREQKLIEVRRRWEEAMRKEGMLP
jgi:hypothetical protein